MFHEEQREPLSNQEVDIHAISQPQREDATAASGHAHLYVNPPIAQCSLDDRALLRDRSLIVRYCDILPFSRCDKRLDVIK